MIEFSAHTWGFNDKPLPVALGTIARLGFRYVDIGSGPHLNTQRAANDPEAVAAEIRAELDAYHLKVSDLYLMLPRISVADETARKNDVAQFKALLPFAVALGTPGITVSPGVAQPKDAKATEKRVVAALRLMIRWARDAKLALSFEPHLDSVAHTPEDARRLVERVPELKITLDWAHLITQGMKPERAAPLLPFTRHIQVRQAAPRRMQTPFDQGVLDIDRVMALLLSAGYEGVVSVELMQTIGWHGAAEVNAIQEAIQLRDALRNSRDALRSR